MLVFVGALPRQRCSCLRLNMSFGLTLLIFWLQMDFPTLPGSHRILNVHQNVPGVLKNVNNIIADLNVNIKAQVRVCLNLLVSHAGVMCVCMLERLKTAAS